MGWSQAISVTQALTEQGFHVPYVLQRDKDKWEYKGQDQDASDDIVENQDHFGMQWESERKKQMKSQRNSSGELWGQQNCSIQGSRGWEIWQM